MTRILRIGFIGAGMMSQVAHLPFYARDPRCRVVALAETRPRMAEAVRSEYGIERSTDDHCVLLEDPTIDAIVMVAPRGAVGPLSQEVLRSGKHLLTEKPMAHTAEQARQLLALVQPSQKYCIGFMKRYDPGVQAGLRQLKALQEAGLSGALLSARIYSRTKRHAVGPGHFLAFGEHRAARFSEWPLAPDWLPADAVPAYAWFINAAIHDLNLARHFLGEMQVHAARRGRSGAVAALLQAAGDVPVTLEFSAAATPGWQEGVELIFENAAFRLRLPSPLDRQNAAHFSLWCGDLPAGDLPASADSAWSEPWAFAHQASAFVTDILEDRQPICAGEACIGDLDLAEQIWRAIIR